MAGPGVLFVLPFLLPVAQFASFAAVLAIAQLISGCGSFGLDIACPRLKVKPFWVLIYSLLSITFSAAVILFGFGNSLNENFVLSALIAWLGTLTATLHSYSIFSGRASLYGIIGVAKAVGFLAVLSISMGTGVEPGYAWFFSTLGSLCIVFVLMKWRNGFRSDPHETGEVNWRDVLRFSAPLAILIAVGALPFVADRAIAQYVLEPQQFAKYAVAVAWATPIIYIGNIIQQAIVGARQRDTLRSVSLWAGGIFALGVGYVAVVGALTLFVVRVPYFSSGRDFVGLWGWIAGWYVLYSALHFPVAAIVQKYFSANELKPLAYASATIGIGFLAVVYLVDASVDLFARAGFWVVVILMVLSSAAGVAPKIFFAVRHLKK